MLLHEMLTLRQVPPRLNYHSLYDAKRNVLEDLFLRRVEHSEWTNQYYQPLIDDVYHHSLVNLSDYCDISCVLHAHVRSIEFEWLQPASYLHFDET